MDGQELRRQREALGLTQAQLATRFGVSLRTLQEWEYGDRAIRPMVELAMRELIRQSGKRQRRMPRDMAQFSFCP
jgi:DNA-binding transcriptional regulator YiaG